ncbi:uncharacterized protein LOC130802471 [Amaranthus tricolor]|uniref:uncharacterized protein LOC130802471 n=1 Tax=Amaranthus tricolor TaxID=29722 RepID=UPI00258DB5CE|nr:uncharacterized protein LOC130802471 [Amaranthus tricolor]
MHSELATELGNVRVDEVEVDTSDVAHEVVDELETPNVDAVVGQMGPPNTYTENVVYGLDDVFIGEDEIRLIVDKKIDEENNRDIYVNDDELESDDDLGALNVDEEGIVSCATFNPEVDFKGKINLSLGLKFPSIYVFRKALRYHAVECAENYIEDWRENPNWDLRAFMKRVNREIDCEVNYSKCYMAKRIAKKMIVGDANEEYSRVWDYAEAIRRFNPGSTAIVKCIGIDTPPPLFQRMYICLPACKEGFVAGCRPIIGVDGAHLKGEFPGVLLTAVGKDGNNNIFPVAWAVVETENVETWTWFLNLLVEDLKSVSPSSSCARAGCEDFTFMSDRQKGLIEALNSVVPEVEIRFCCRHIWANFKIKFPGELYKQHFWRAARAYNKIRNHV